MPNTNFQESVISVIRVANIGSASYDYRNTNFIAANPVIFEELTQGPDAIFPIGSQGNS